MRCGTRKPCGGCLRNYSSFSALQIGAEVGLSLPRACLRLLVLAATEFQVFSHMSLHLPKRLRWRRLPLFVQFRDLCVRFPRGISRALLQRSLVAVCFHIFPGSIRRRIPQSRKIQMLYLPQFSSLVPRIDYSSIKDLFRVAVQRISYSAGVLRRTLP
jgi:hypothetical protein